MVPEVRLIRLLEAAELNPVDGRCRALSQASSLQHEPVPWPEVCSSCQLSFTFSGDRPDKKAEMNEALAGSAMIAVHS